MPEDIAFSWRSFLKQCLMSIAVFYMATTDALCVTYVMLVHGWSVYCLGLVSFLSISLFYYWFDLKYCLAQCRSFVQSFLYHPCVYPKSGTQYSDGVYHNALTHGLAYRGGCWYVMRDVDGLWQEDCTITRDALHEYDLLVIEYRRNKYAWRFLYGCVLILTMAFAGLYAGVTYAGATVFIYNTLLSQFAMHAHTALLLANALVIPATLLVFGMAASDFASMLIHVVQSVRQWFSQIPQNMAAMRWRATVVRLLVWGIACAITFFVSHIMTKLALYGLKRFCVAVLHYSVAPVVPQYVFWMLFTVIALFFLKSLLSTAEWCLSQDFSSKIQKNMSILDWIKFSLFVFLGMIRVMIQAIGAQTFVRGVAPSATVASGALDEANRLLDWAVSASDTTVQVSVKSKPSS